MSIHRCLDIIAQNRMGRRRTPPVECTPGELEGLLAESGDALHPAIEPVDLLPLPDQMDGGVTHLTYDSPCCNAPPELRRGYVVMRRSSAPDAIRTALLLVHGSCAADHSRADWFIPPAQERWWDTFSIELPHHMRRQVRGSEYSGQFLVTADIARLIRGMHQSETEIRAIIKALRRMGYERVALGGVSLGGNAVLQAVIREAVDAAFVLVPAADAFASLWASVLGSAIAPEARAAGISDELARRALALVTPVRMGRPATHPGRLLYIYGVNDLLCPPEPVLELQAAWGGHLRPLETGHATLVARQRTVIRIVGKWMDHIRRLLRR